MFTEIFSKFEKKKSNFLKEGRYTLQEYLKNFKFSRIFHLEKKVSNI